MGFAVSSIESRLYFMNIFDRFLSLHLLYLAKKEAVEAIIPLREPSRQTASGQ